MTAVRKLVPFLMRTKSSVCMLFSVLLLILLIARVTDRVAAAESGSGFEGSIETSFARINSLDDSFFDESTDAHSELEDDEFDFSEEPQQSNPEPSNETKTSRPFSFFRHEHLISNIPLDVSAVVILVIVLLAAWKGKRENEEFANDWKMVAAPVFDANFAFCGFPGEYLKMRQWHLYEFYGTGRRNCEHLNLFLQLQPRQCLWKYWFLSYISNVEDSVVMEFSLASLDTIVFAIVRKREQVAAVESYKDLKLYSKIYKSDLVIPLVVLAESAEVKDIILKSRILKGIEKYADYVKLIHISDLWSGSETSESKRMLRVVLKIPDRKNLADFEPLLKTVMSLVDFVTTIFLPEKLRSSITDKRYTITKHLIENSEKFQEQEEAKRAEKKKHEDERFNRMTPEQQRKFEEKQNKKQNKPRFKVI